MKEQIKFDIKKREDQLFAASEIEAGEIFIDSERNEVMMMLDFDTLSKIFSIREDPEFNFCAVSLERGEPVHYKIDPEKGLLSQKKILKKVKSVNVVIEEI